MIDDHADVLEMRERINTFIIPEWNPQNETDTVLYDLVSLLLNTNNT